MKRPVYQKAAPVKCLMTIAMVLRLYLLKIQSWLILKRTIKDARVNQLEKMLHWPNRRHPTVWFSLLNIKEHCTLDFSITYYNHIMLNVCLLNYYFFNFYENLLGEYFFFFIRKIYLCSFCILNILCWLFFYSHWFNMFC